MANLVWDIVKHPIRFFETLVSGLIQGIGRFIDNIGTYMKEAFWTWITGATSKSIQPSSASGIESLFDSWIQVLNLSAADIREIVERIAGKDMMQKIEKGIEPGEKALEPLSILLYEGPLAFWNYIKDKLEDIIKSSL